MNLFGNRERKREILVLSHDFLYRDDLPFRYISEQVSHHPPVSAFSCESKDNGARWRFYGSILPKAKFSVKNMEVNPKGLLMLELKR